MRRLSGALSVDARRLRTRHQVTPPQLLCLLELEDGPASVDQLSEAVGLSGVIVSRLLERLAERNLVERDYPSAKLTPKGSKLAKEAPAPAEVSLIQRLEKLPLQEQEKVAEILELVSELLETKDLPESWSESMSE